MDDVQLAEFTITKDEALRRVQAVFQRCMDWLALDEQGQPLENETTRRMALSILALLTPEAFHVLRDREKERANG